MAMTLITTNTSSGAASSSFTSSIDSTYKLYIFKFYDVNPATDTVKFSFQGSTDGGSNYNVTMTTTFFQAYHDEADSDTSLGYSTGYDQAQGTSFQTMGDTIGNGADESCAGELSLFNPSNTTYVTHDYSKTNNYLNINYCGNAFVAGYFNTTSAIDAMQFKMSSGNFDGTIKMYGVG